MRFFKQRSNMISQMQSVLAVLLITGCSLCTAAHDGAPHPTTNTSHVKNVHIIYMNHLDVGYDSIPGMGFINRILLYYFHEYFPRAAKLGKELAAGEYMETFIYTTHPWLVTMYLNCPPNLILAGYKLQCPNAKEVAEFKQAVYSGVITWQAAPMNMQPEFTDSSLFEFSLSISQQLDQQFGIKRTGRVMSQRDVPGMTHAAIPSLLKMGISAVTVGVNPMTSPPDVPQLFRWQYGGHEVLASWHPGGYPNNPGPDPAHPGGISVKDCVVQAGIPDALCFAFRTDNSGPPTSVQEVLGYYEILRKEFPNAHLAASRLEDYFTAVEPFRSQLPVVTKEIGDTWIMGVASDPRKSAEYRAVMRVLKACVQKGDCKYTDTRVWNASRILTKTGEHTWGLPSVNDTRNWSNQDFYKARSGLNYVNCTLAWLEQRNITYTAVDALQGHPVAAQIREELGKLTLAWPQLQGYIEIADMTHSMICSPGITLQFGMDGALNGLTYAGVKWATPDSPLGVFQYVTYDEADFVRLSKLYDYVGNAGFTKRNVTANAHPISRMWHSTLREVFVKEGGGCEFYAHVEVLDKETWTYYGAPQDIWIHYSVRDKPYPGLDVELQLFDKTSTRLPEAMFYSFLPAPQTDYTWTIYKMNRPINPLNVMLNGSQYLHAVSDEGVVYASNQSKVAIQIQSWDVPLACPITDRLTTPTAIPVPLQPINKPIAGMGFNLYNNIWDTNYIFWYPYIEQDKNFKARFAINFITKH